MKRRLSEERILQITNDISEDMCNAKRADLMEVVSYWANTASELAMAISSIRSKVIIGLLSISQEIDKSTPPSLRPNKQQQPNSKNKRT